MIGVVAPGHFKRLAAEVGFLHAWYEASQKGFPLPGYICGVSAGGIAAACAAQWTEEDFKRSEEVLLSLQRKDFYTVSPNLKIKGSLTAILPALSILLPIEKVKSSFARTAMRLGVIGTALGLDGYFIKELLLCDSIFSNANLHKLLISHLRFDKIFRSPIKIEIGAADINNRRFNTVCNHNPEHQDKETFTRGIVDSTRLPVFFPFRENKEGHYLADGAAIANAPISLARKQNCDVIVVLNFNCMGEGPTTKKYHRWIPGLQRFIDLIVDETSRKAIRSYKNVNNDLEQMEVQKKCLEDLEKLIDIPYLCEITKQDIRVHIQAIHESIAKLSYANKRKIKLIIVNSDTIPEFHFSSFNKEQTRSAINAGYKAFYNSFKPQFEKINNP